MKATIVRGMPYATMIYNTTSQDILPTIYSAVGLETLVVDDANVIDYCSSTASDLKNVWPLSRDHPVVWN